MVVLIAMLVVLCVGVASALGDSPVWRIDSLSNPTAVPGGTFVYRVQATNVGSAETDGSPFEVTATLPSGFAAIEASGEGFECAGPGGSPVGGATVVTCGSTATIPAHSNSSYPAFRLKVAVASSASGVVTGSFDVSGGGAGSASTVDSTIVTPIAPGFGVDAFDEQVSATPSGEPFTQAGGHPYDATTSIDFNTTTNPNPLIDELWPVEPTKDVLVDLAPGYVVNPTIAATCTASQLANSEFIDPRPLCSPVSQVGTILLHVNEDSAASVYGPWPVFRLVAPPGRPARFGFNVLGTVVTFDGGVRSGSDFGLSASFRDISEGLESSGSALTLWGVPADPSHDAERACPGQSPPWVGGPSCASGAPLRAFIRYPTSCPPAGVGLTSTMRIDSWTNPGIFKEATTVSHLLPGYPAAPLEWGARQGPTGCEGVPFEPSASVRPRSGAPDSPSSADVKIAVPQAALSVPGVVSQADVRRVSVTFPEGVSANPSVAGGLQGCSPAQIGLLGSGFPAPNPIHFDENTPSCPEASVMGTLEIETPLLEEPLEGSLYLASPGDNPFGALLAVYVVAQGPGVILKLAGHIVADPVTGRLTVVFDDLPQLPFSALTVSLKDGPRAPLRTPGACGSSQTETTMEGWNGKSVSIHTPYSVDCTPGLGGFNPSFTAGTVNNQAGAFSPFVLSFSRNDGEQALAGVQQTLAPGLSAKLAGIPLCSDSDAAVGSCPAGSQIGSVTVAAGVGVSPFSIGGKIYLTGPYNGGPFGEVVVVHAAAGPFDLGTVAVRGSIRIDPHTAQATVISDPFPQILQGIPIALRRVDVSLDRPGFTFNPTNCEALSIPGTLTSSQGAQAHVSSHFQAANCATLPFKPTFKVATKATSSKKNGAALDVKVTSGAGQANLGKVAVTLPKQLPSWLPTIQQACLAAVFNQNPAACPAGSDIGTATATTPILSSPVTGPVYLVSHGGAAFPDIVMVLQGEGVTVEQVGSINIKGQVTSSAFNTIPDVPINTFELNLPQGPHHALSSNLPAKAKGSFCGQSLVMPTTLTGQNGAQIKQSTKIAVTGCPKARKKPKKHPKKKGKK